MTDMGRMSVQELLGKMLADEHADVLRQAVCWLAQELMEAKFSLAAGAGCVPRPGRWGVGHTAAAWPCGPPRPPTASNTRRTGQLYRA